MSSNSLQVFRQSDMKQKDIGKFVNKNEIFTEKGKFLHNQFLIDPKSGRKLKSPKKYQDCKKSITDSKKLEDVFFNSAYFKHQASNQSISFCSGDNGELRWTIDSKFEIPAGQKPLKGMCYSGKDLTVATKEIGENNLNKEEIAEKPEELLDGALADGGRYDRDLVSLITEQMFLAERELQITRTHLIETISKLNERDLEIIQLHEKIQHYQKKENAKTSNEEQADNTKTSEDFQKLVAASEKLKKQVKDMEEFLNDYGLVWVGDKESNQKPDFDKVIKSFQRLNSIAAQPKIIQTTMGAKFELPREVSITFYSNGMLLRNNDFREYNKISTTMFLQDIEDGYFPSELQNEYPDGVPFEITDKRNEVYKQKSAEIELFKGNGQRLGSTFENKRASMVYLEPLHDSKAHHSSACVNADYLDSKTLLKKYQKKRSKNHSSFQNETKVHSSRDYLHQLMAIQDRESAHDFKPRSVHSERKKIKIKIRSGAGINESFILYLSENSKLAELHELLRKKFLEKVYESQLQATDNVTNKKHQLDYELHVYGLTPFRLLDNMQKTLKDCGIVDNCVVNVTEI